jgi:hypothetical protein
MAGVLEVDGRGSNFTGSARREVNTVQKYVQKKKYVVKPLSSGKE